MTRTWEQFKAKQVLLDKHPQFSAFVASKEMFNTEYPKQVEQLTDLAWEMAMRTSGQWRRQL